MQDRILNLVNLLLLLTCGGFIYYLATARYEEPAEVVLARQMIEEETTFSPPTGLPPASPISAPGLPINTNSFKVLYTPTPTPSPTPTPKPPPPNLQQAVSGWKLREVRLSAQTAVFLDERNNQTIRLTVGGEPYEGDSAVDQAQKRVTVVLARIETGSDPAAYLIAGVDANGDGKPDDPEVDPTVVAIKMFQR